MTDNEIIRCLYGKSYEERKEMLNVLSAMGIELYMRQNAHTNVISVYRPGSNFALTYIIPDPRL